MVLKQCTKLHCLAENGSSSTIGWTTNRVQSLFYFCGFYSKFVSDQRITGGSANSLIMRQAKKNVLVDRKRGQKPFHLWIKS